MRCPFVAFAVALSVPVCLLAQAKPARAAPDLFAASREARDGGRFGMLLRQFRADEPTLPARHEAGQKPATPAYQGARDIPAGHWVWRKPYWFVFRDGPGDAPQQRQWGPEAACGAPDTPQPGDSSSAWAMNERDAKDEWLLLEYETPVRATAIEVHETFNPGALEAVSILTPQGEVLELWRNREVKAAEEKGRVLQIDLPLGFEVERVLLQFASDAVPDWNEIDAVGLRDDRGKVHWASRAEGSSTYADTNAQAAAPGIVGQRQQLAWGAFQVQPLRVQVELPRLVVQAREVQVAQPLVWQVARPRGLAVQFTPAEDAEKKQLAERVRTLEARVAELEAELARKKAGK
jgi:hypothetical protein